MKPPPLSRPGGRVLALLLAALAVSRGGADGPALPETFPSPQPDLGRAPLVPLRVLATPPPEAPAAGPNRIRLFRMQPGFMSDIPWLQDEDRAAPGAKPLDAEPDSDFLSLSYGNDNPYFDFRTAGDPGGVGFARVYSQVQLFDTSRTAASFGLQAVMPLGQAYDGLADNRGATVVTPGFSLFHELDDGLGIQAYVGRHMPLVNKSVQSVSKEFQYGVAVHRPVTTNQADPLSNLFFSVGAVGQQRLEPDGGRTLNWDVLPGVHLRLADTWWLSGGMVLPVGPSRYDNGGHWRLTCQWQF